VAIAHAYGSRVPSEILTRERRHVDLEAGTLRLDPGETKNGEGRVVYLTPELKALLGIVDIKAVWRRSPGPWPRSP
jgi:integrase